MTSYRRLRIPGGAYFFTVNLADRTSLVLTDNIDLLRWSVGSVLGDHPVRINAMVILPDHLHAVWTMADGDSDFSTRWQKIKTRFTKALGCEYPRSASKHAKGEKGLWQRRFWEHAIRDRQDLVAHVHYCWVNPVKHGYVRHAVDWPYSSIHRDIARDRVPADWTGEIMDDQFGERA